MSRLQQARLAAIVNQARQRVPEFERRLDRLAALSQTAKESLSIRRARIAGPRHHGIWSIA
jgi:hypothetical protein